MAQRRVLAPAEPAELNLDLADHVEVDSQPGQGTKVRFVKRLEAVVEG